MHTIYKYHLPTSGLVDLPEYADVLSVGEQEGEIYLWALVDPHEMHVLREFRVYGTGWTCEEDPRDFVGTVQMQNGPVFHIFTTGGKP